jgi:energy-coupling factor transport system permease protein
MTRGIENPKMRTSRLDIRIRLIDHVVIAIFVVTLIMALVLSTGGKV